MAAPEGSVARRQLGALFWHWLSLEATETSVVKAMDQIREGLMPRPEESLAALAAATGAAAVATTPPHKSSRKDAGGFSTAAATTTHHQSPAKKKSESPSRRCERPLAAGDEGDEDDRDARRAALTMTPTLAAPRSPVASSKAAGEAVASRSLLPRLARRCAAAELAFLSQTAPVSQSSSGVSELDAARFSFEAACAAKWLAADPTGSGLACDAFAPLACELAEVPSAVGAALFRRVAELHGTLEGDRVSCRAFLAFHRTALAHRSATDRLFAVVAKHGASQWDRDDLEPLVAHVVQTHPGLAFLQSHAEFQQKYAATVVARLFYRCDLSRTGAISRRELRFAQPSVVSALHALDLDADINAELTYFSYEHFYVLYCRFWELDSNRDAKLSRDDLLKYGGRRLSRAIVERVFDAAPRPFCDGGCGATKRRVGQKSSAAPGSLSAKKRALCSRAARDGEDADVDGDDTAVSSEAEDSLSYADFVYFMLSEEDKGNEASIRYWFECCDLDADGIVSTSDARHFYEMQARRLECLGHEVVTFEDVLCQMADLVDPHSVRVSNVNGRGGACSLAPSDLLRPDKIKVAGVFFDSLFALDKFVAFEQRDPFYERQKRDDPFHTDWDRFAAAEYARLATEDDAAAADDDDNYAQDDDDDAAFADDGARDDDDDDDDQPAWTEQQRQQRQVHEAPF